MGLSRAVCLSPHAGIVSEDHRRDRGRHADNLQKRPLVLATDQGADFRGSRPKRGSRAPSRPAGFFVGVSALDLTLEIGTFRMMESTLKSRDELRTTTFMEGLLHSS